MRAARSGPHGASPRTVYRPSSPRAASALAGAAWATAIRWNSPAVLGEIDGDPVRQDRDDEAREGGQRLLEHGRAPEHVGGIEEEPGTRPDLGRAGSRRRAAPAGPGAGEVTGAPNASRAGSRRRGVIPGLHEEDDAPDPAAGHVVERRAGDRAPDRPAAAVGRIQLDLLEARLAAPGRRGWAGAARRAGARCPGSTGAGPGPRRAGVPTGRPPARSRRGLQLAIDHRHPGPETREDRAPGRRCCRSARRSARAARC